MVDVMAMAMAMADTHFCVGSEWVSVMVSVMGSVMGSVTSDW